MRREYKIRLSETSDVKDFVTSAEKCDFDIDISYNRFILGVLSLDLTKVLTVQCAEKNADFEKTIQKYCVA